jgi:hypothetical protein
MYVIISAQETKWAHATSGSVYWIHLRTRKLMGQTSSRFQYLNKYHHAFSEKRMTDASAPSKQPMSTGSVGCSTQCNDALDDC